MHLANLKHNVIIVSIFLLSFLFDPLLYHVSITLTSAFCLKLVEALGFRYHVFAVLTKPVSPEDEAIVFQDLEIFKCVLQLALAVSEEHAHFSFFAR